MNNVDRIKLPIELGSHRRAPPYTEAEAEETAPDSAREQRGGVLIRMPPPRPGKDDDIAVAINAHDFAAASELLVRRYGGAVRRYCAHVLQSNDVGDDVAQQVFLEAYQALSTYRGQSAVSTWLFGIAHHRCVDACRKRRRWYERVFASDDWETQAIAVDPPTEDVIDAAVLSEALESCLDRLRPDLKSLLLRVYKEGQSYEDIGSQTHKQPGTLRMRAKRTLLKVRECLSKRGIEP